MPQEWDSTLSPPGMSPPHVFHNILYSLVQSADRGQFSHIAAERQHWGPATPLPHLRGSGLTVRECNAPTHGVELRLPRFLTGSVIVHPSPKLRFHRRLPTGTSRLHSPLLAHWGRHRLNWADAAGLRLDFRPHEHIREHVCTLYYFGSAYRRNISPF